MKSVSGSNGENSGSEKRNKMKMKRKAGRNNKWRNNGEAAWHRVSMKAIMASAK
jgi:hypothetical protein